MISTEQLQQPPYRAELPAPRFVEETATHIKIWRRFILLTENKELAKIPISEPLAEDPRYTAELIRLVDRTLVVEGNPPTTTMMVLYSALKE